MKFFTSSHCPYLLSLLASIYLVVSTVYLPRLVRPFAWFYWPLIVLDLFAIYLCVACLFKVALLYTFSILIQSCMLHYHLIELYTLLRTLIQRLSRHIRVPVQIEQIELRYFLAEHTLICTNLLRNNREISGNMVFAFLLTNIPVNIYLCIRLFKVHMQPVETFVFGAFMSIQILFTMVVLLAIAHRHRSIHCIYKWLPRLQFYIRGGNLLHKLKYDSLLQRLTTGPKYGVTIGPLYTVTRKVIFEASGQILDKNQFNYFSRLFSSTLGVFCLHSSLISNKVGDYNSE